MTKIPPAARRRAQIRQVNPLTPSREAGEATRLIVAVQHLVNRVVELLLVPGVLFSRASSQGGSVRVVGPSDEHLVALFKNGDRKAFELLVRRYQNLAFTIARRYLGNSELAEETAQDVFISLYRNLGKFRGDASFKSWFYRVVVNHCRNRHKALDRRRHHRHDSIDGADGDDERRPRELVDKGPDPEHALNAVREQAMIERALESLSEQARLVLLLREGQGLSYDEIAAILGIRAGTVKSRIHRARADLKRAVARLSKA